MTGTAGTPAIPEFDDIMLMEIHMPRRQMTIGDTLRSSAFVAALVVSGCGAAMVAGGHGLPLTALAAVYAGGAAGAFRLFLGVHDRGLAASSKLACGLAVAIIWPLLAAGLAAVLLIDSGEEGASRP